MLAKHALYQLSYGPESEVRWVSAFLANAQGVVGPGRLELPTSRLSGVRSNQLSYGPSAKTLGLAIAPRGLEGTDPWPAAIRGKRNEDGDDLHLCICSMTTK